MFKYGGDCMDPVKLMKVRTKVLTLPGTPHEVAVRWCGGDGVEAERLAPVVALAKKAGSVFGKEINTIHLPFDLYDDFVTIFNGACPPVEEILPMVLDAEKEIVRIIGDEISCNHILVHVRSTVVSNRLPGVSVDDVKYMLDKAVEKTQQAIITGGEMVGTLAAQSIGEPATQMTLNSVEYNTDLVIRWNQRLPMPQNACVGETIDALLKNFEHRVQFPTPDTAYLPLEKGVAEALTVDDDGNVSWKTLEAVTRHPPINKDGSNTLVKITTRSGRTVTATKAKSFLVVEEGKVVTKEGSELKVEDKIPVLRTLPKEDLTEVNLRGYLDPKQYIFTTTMESAYSAMRSTPKRQPWFGPFSNLLPYSRSDSCRVALEKFLYLRIPGFVYTKMHNETTKGILEKIVLNRSFGFFVGAYLAEGCCTEHQIHIANNCLEYRQRAAEWPSSLGIQYHLTNEKYRMKNNGVSISIMFHSTLLSTLMKTWCNQGSWNKRVPHFAYSAPRSFIIGLLDGYLSGDGTVHTNGSMNGSSRSKALIEGISLLLTRLGIPSTLGSDMVVGSLQHRLYITIYDAQKLHAQMTFCVPMKEQRLQHVSREKKRRKKFKQKSTLNDVFVDPVVKIEEVVSEHPYVYDLTVAETRNMVTASGLTQRDTFHSAGTGNRTVLRGVPRFKEIIDVSKNPKAPSCTVYLNSELERSKSCVEQLAKGMKRVLLSEVVASKTMIYDPNDTVVSEDTAMVERYRVVVGKEKQVFPWICRLCLDHEKIHRLSLNMNDITRALRIFMQDKAEVIASEADEGRCIIRIRPIQTNVLKKCMDRAETDDETRALEKMVVTDMVDIVVESCRISGLGAIRNTFTVGRKNSYHIETEGTDFQEIMASGSAVDAFRIQSNSIHDNLFFLGVAAAVTVLFREAHDVLTEGGSVISPRHLELLALKMSYSGIPIPVTRHGMAKAKHSVLLRASFERTVDTFMEGAMHSISDTCNGIVESIVMGQVPKMGSGFIDIIAPVTKKKRSLEEEEEGEGEFIGRRKRSVVVPAVKKQRWTESIVYKHSWDFSMDPKRTFNLFKIKFTCQNQHQSEVFTPPMGFSFGWGGFGHGPTSPAYNPNGPGGISPVYNPNSPVYNPNGISPAYNPNGPTSPAYNPDRPTTPTTPPFHVPQTPPFMCRTDQTNTETPPTTPPLSGLSPEFSTTPTWYNGPDTPKEVNESTPQLDENKTDAEWAITMASPHFDEDGLMPWVVNPRSPMLLQ